MGAGMEFNEILVLVVLKEFYDGLLLDKEFVQGIQEFKGFRLPSSFLLKKKKKGMLQKVTFKQ